MAARELVREAAEYLFRPQPDGARRLAYQFRCLRARGGETELPQQRREDTIDSVEWVVASRTGGLIVRSIASASVDLPEPDPPARPN